MIMALYESQRRDGARVDLPLANRDHPLQRWIDAVGVPQPPKPEHRIRELRIPQ